MGFTLVRRSTFTLLAVLLALAAPDRGAAQGTGRVLGPASTKFNDYLGTVAADDANAVIYEPSLDD